MWKQLFSVCVIFGVVQSATIPSYIHVCHRNDPKVSACIKNSIEDLRPRLKQGIPELDVPSLEPLRINNIHISRGIGFFLNLTEVDVFSASDFQISKLKLDVPNMTYKIGLIFPKMRLMGKYAVDTRLLSLPIQSNGHFDANATNLHGIGILQAERTQVDGIDQMKFTNLEIQLKMEDYNLRLENLGFGDESLNEAINQFINSNKDELIKISTPFIESKASETLLSFANKIVRNFDYNTVFPE